MFCKHCGVEQPDQVKFCSKCGGALSSESDNKNVESFVPLDTLPHAPFIKCAICNYEGKAIKGRSDFGIVLAWLAVLLMPLITILYFVFTREWKCPKCKSTHIGVKDINGIYQQQKASGILIALIVIPIGLAIIGILASVVLASLSAARDKAVEQQNIEYLEKDNSIQEEISLTSIKKSVVNIVCESTIDGELSGGSGTMILTDGTILTASHIFPQDEDTVYVDPDEGCLVMLPNEYTGETEEIYWAEPVIIPGLSDLYDIALMSITSAFVDEEGIAYGTYPKVFHSFWDSDEYGGICTDDKLDINLGDKIRVLGYPTTSGGMSLTITEGIISALNDDGNLLTTAKIDSGNSGGIAVAEDGCIIGMPIAVREGDYEKMGAIIPGEKITDFFTTLEIYLD